MNKSLVFIVVDGLRKDFMLQNSFGFQKFADNGVFFDQLITHAPETFLSIGTHLTGLYPFKHRSGCKRFEGILSMFDYLRDTHDIFMQAYHQPFGSSFTPTEYERDFGYIGEENSRKTMGMCPDISAAIDFLNASRNKSVFVYLHLFTLRCIENILPMRVDLLCSNGRFQEVLDATHVALSQIDAQISILYDALERRLDSHLVVITSDHGESYKLLDNRILGDSGVAWNLHNGSRYEESINIPMIVCGLDVPKNRILKKQIRQIDVFPTLMKALDVELQTQIDGEAIEFDDDKIIEKPIFVCRTSETFKRVIRLPDGFKLIYDADSVELFDLKKDPKETTNLANKMPEKVKELLEIANDFFMHADFTKRDIISKYVGWQRLSDNWETMKSRFYNFNIDDWRYKSERYGNIIGVRAIQYISDLSDTMHLNECSKVLEVGIGTGIVSRYLLNFTKNVFGVDISPSMLALTDENINTYIAFADSLPFANETYDVVFGRQVYHNLNEYFDSAISEAKRILKPNGKFIIAEFIPPSDDLADEWTNLRISKEKRVFSTYKELTDIFYAYDFDCVFAHRNVIARASLNNWLYNWCESDKARSEVRKRFLSASEKYKKAINFTILNNDILFDMHYGIVCGVKR